MTKTEMRSSAKKIFQARKSEELPKRNALKGKRSIIKVTLPKPPSKEDSQTLNSEELPKREVSKEKQSTIKNVISPKPPSSDCEVTICSSDYSTYYLEELRSIERNAGRLGISFTRDEEEEEYLIRLLSRRAMHLPHMNWCQDWLQYMKNNHPLFGIFFHHPLHPLKVGHRLCILLASTAFGLVATNVVYLYCIFNDEEMDKILVQIAMEDSPVRIQNIEELQLTYGTVLLWSVGGILHSIFDICMWYLSACSCFMTGSSCGKRGKYQKVGFYIVIALAAVLVTLAIFMVLARSVYDMRLRLAEEQVFLDDIKWEEITRVRNFSFLLTFAIELGFVHFAYYPLLITLLLVGIPPLFGRGTEIQKQYRERIAMEQKYHVDGFDRFDDNCLDLHVI